MNLAFGFFKKTCIHISNSFLDGIFTKIINIKSTRKKNNTKSKTK